MIVAMAERHPRARHQAGRPPAQHAHAALHEQGEADPEGQGDPRGLRARWPTGSASTRSGGSSRTWPSPRCTRAGTARSSRWSTSAGPTARRTSRRPARSSASELEAVGHRRREITGRAKHFYSIYDKMTRKGKEFNEIYDLTAMRVLVDSVKDCYGAVGIIHSLWKPLPGRFKDYIAMPKLNMYQSLHTTVIGPEGKPLEIQIRTYEMHETAEFGVAAHWLYKEGGGDQPRLGLADDGLAVRDQGPRRVHGVAALRPLPRRGLRLHAQGRGPRPARRRHAARLRLRRPHRRRPPLRRREGQRAHRAAHVHAAVGRHRRDPHLQGRRAAPSRDWLQLVTTTKARSKISQFFRRERREDAEHLGREAAAGAAAQGRACRASAWPGSPLLLEVIQEMGFKKADEFYISLGLQKTSVQVVVNKILHRLKAGQAVAEERPGHRRARAGAAPTRPTASSDLGIEIDGLADVLVRLAKCCKPVPGDPILGYISLGRGITIHREDCPNAKALKKNPERFTPVSWSGANQQSFRVEIAVDAWDRARLLEDLSRAFAEAGVNIISANCLDGGPDGPRPLRGRGRRHRDPEALHQRPAPGGVGLRRLSGDARGHRPHRPRCGPVRPGHLLRVPRRWNGSISSSPRRPFSPSSAWWLSWSSPSGRGDRIRRLEERLAERGDAAEEAPLQRIAELQARTRSRAACRACRQPDAHRRRRSRLVALVLRRRRRRASGTCSCAATAAADASDTAAGTTAADGHHRRPRRPSPVEQHAGAGRRARRSPDKSVYTRRRLQRERRRRGRRRRRAPRRSPPRAGTCRTTGSTSRTSRTR